MTTDATTTALRRCIGSAKFGIEAHEAPPDEFPAQPSQKDGLGRMCKPHWNQYTSALRKAALARKAAEASADRAGARRGARADPDAGQARAQDGRAGGRLPGRRRIGRPPPADPRAPGANPGPFHVRSRHWPWPFFIAPRGPTVAPVGAPRSFAETVPSGIFGETRPRAHDWEARIPGAQNPRVGTPGRRLAHPS